MHSKNFGAARTKHTVRVSQGVAGCRACQAGQPSRLCSPSASSRTRPVRRTRRSERFVRRDPPQHSLELSLPAHASRRFTKPPAPAKTWRGQAGRRRRALRGGSLWHGWATDLRPRALDLHRRQALRSIAVRCSVPDPHAVARSCEAPSWEAVRAKPRPRGVA
jgi:hypothetical protein